jgi:intracellular septation protein A
MEQKQENAFLSLALNIIIPSFILMKLSDESGLGPVKSLLIALAFPIVYGIYDFFDRKKVNFISLLGLISISLTGVFTIIKLPAHWIAVKEAFIPGLIGVAIVGSMKTKFPLIEKLLFNEAIINTKLVHSKLTELENESAFHMLLNKSSYLLACSFFLSSALNFILAKAVLTAEPGSVNFNEQLGKMTALSWPVIVIPSTLIMGVALWQLVKGLKKLTGLELEQILKAQPEKPKQ